jgi:octaprenyl-diphosphate synthase
VKAAVVGIEARGPVLGSLQEVCAERGVPSMQERIAELRSFLAADLAGIELDLASLEERPTPMHLSARHLVKSGGKRLRPMCVALASRVGQGFDPRARDLAVAAELVHSATLLHDDVVDVGDRRRGEPSARVLYGNAASVFAGDWLLVEALMRVRRTGLGDVLERALGVLAEMLEGEALQLARRGRIEATMDDYLRVVRGKTASLFRWAMYAGARAGSLDAPACEALETFGAKLGVAFQVVDDVLDVDGDAGLVGKELLGDLREGKLTYPLLVALDRRPSLREELAEALAGEGAELPPATAQRAADAMKETGACDEGRAYAERLVREAVSGLRALPARPAVGALETVAETIASRRN